MKFTFALASLVAICMISVGADNGKCVQDYNQNSGLDCGPGKNPCVILLNEGHLISSPNKALTCSKDGKACQYPKYSKMTAQCNQGKVTVQFAGSNNNLQNHANNAFAYFASNNCTHPSDQHSSQDGDSVVINCNPLSPHGGGGKCEPDYNFERNQTAKANFECGPGKSHCVMIEGTEGSFIQSPNKADNCDPFTRLCTFPKYSKFTVQCPQGTVTAQFAGKKNTFQNHAENSIVYWMSHKCDGPSKSLSTQDGDLLVVKCNGMGKGN